MIKNKAMLAVLIASAFGAMASTGIPMPCSVRTQRTRPCNTHPMITASDGEIRAHNHAVQTRQVLRRRAMQNNLAPSAWKFLREVV